MVRKNILKVRKNNIEERLSVIVTTNRELKMCRGCHNDLKLSGQKNDRWSTKQLQDFLLILAQDCP